MKKKIFIIICLLFIVFLSGCNKTEEKSQEKTDSDYPLNGIWEGIVNYNDCVTAFYGEICFLRFGEHIDKLDFFYENGTGEFLSADGEGLDFIVKGNELTILVDKNRIELKKETKLKPASSAVSGIWKSTNGWLFTFINDKVFLVNDKGSADYAYYLFENNKGSFKSTIWHHDVNFTVDDNKLHAKIVSWYEEDIILVRE